MIDCEFCKEKMKPGTRGPKKRFCSDRCARGSRRKLPNESTCWFCGTELPKKETSGFPRRYCDRVCASKLRTKQKKEARDRTSKCLVCEISFVGSKAGLKYCGAECRKMGNAIKAAERWRAYAESRGEFKEWNCGWCNSKVKVRSSLQGGKKYHDDCAVKARRARNRIKTVRRQGVRSDARITHEEVAERDSFTCYLCGDLVDMSLPRTSRFGATLDHVIPISKGGVDSLDNLKLAHWVCNIRKSDKILEVGDVASEA